MRAIAFIVMLFTLFMVCNCSKDKEVAELEKQVKEAESQDYLADTISKQNALSLKTDTETTGSIVQVPEADSAEVIKSQETPKEDIPTPEKAPEEDVQTPGYTDHFKAGTYTVQIAAGNNPEHIKTLADLYVRRGYNPFISEVAVSGSTIYRLRIGAFENLSDARKLGIELQDKYSVSYWITRN